MMTRQQRQRFFDAWNDHDVDTIVEQFTPHGAYVPSIGPDDEGTAFRGIEEVRRGVSAFLGRYPDAHYADLHVGMGGDRAFATWTFSGTDPEGRTITYRGVDVFELEGDRIRLKDAYRKERSAPLG